MADRLAAAAAADRRHRHRPPGAGADAAASQLAGAITPSRIDVRLPLEGMPREIAPLILAVNEALERLESGFPRPRD